jgi:hypothetical protein
MLIKILIDIDSIDAASRDKNLPYCSIIKVKDVLDELIACLTNGTPFF